MLAKVEYDGKVHRWSKPYLFFDVRPRCKVEKRVMVGSMKEREGERASGVCETGR